MYQPQADQWAVIFNTILTGAKASDRAGSFKVPGNKEWYVGLTRSERIWYSTAGLRKYLADLSCYIETAGHNDLDTHLLCWSQR